MNADWRNRYEVAVAAAQEAGQIGMKYYPDVDSAAFASRVEWKQDQSPVTLADREAEAALRARLLGAFPNDGFLGEESGDTPGSSGYRWIIDPIDGTQLCASISIWATLVGWNFEAEPLRASLVFRRWVTPIVLWSVTARFVAIIARASRPLAASVSAALLFEPLVVCQRRTRGGVSQSCPAHAAATRLWRLLWLPARRPGFGRAHGRIRRPYLGRCRHQAHRRRSRRPLQRLGRHVFH